MPPTISTVIPTFRRPQLLRRAILSVLSQNGPPLEVCVFDNASGDNTARIVAELAAIDPRVRYFCHERNIGGVANFRHALSQVSTPFFTLLCDDDIMLPGFFEQAMRGFETHAEAAFWAGVTVRITPEGTVYDARVENWPREGLFSPPEGLLQMTGGMAPLITGIVFRREVIEEIGLTELDIGAPSDYDFLLRIAAQKSFIISKRAVAMFTLNPHAMSEQAPFSAHWPGWLNIIRNVTSIQALSSETRQRVDQALNAESRRMLFRRSAYALSKRDHDFVRQAAQVLRQHYGIWFHSNLLLLLSTLCGNLAPAQWCYTKTYEAATLVALTRRSALQKRYGMLFRYMD